MNSPDSPAAEDTVKEHVVGPLLPQQLQALITVLEALEVTYLCCAIGVLLLTFRQVINIKFTIRTEILSRMRLLVRIGATMVANSQVSGAIIVAISRVIIVSISRAIIVAICRAIVVTIPVMLVTVLMPGWMMIMISHLPIILERIMIGSIRSR